MINNFKGYYAFLSNFYVINITIEGKLWRTSEAMYMSCKTTNANDRELIRLADTAGQAKRIGRKVTLRPDWESIKDEVMLRCLRRKFTTNQECKEKLMATINHELVEGNYWHDNYWGNCKCNKCIHKVGVNKLGKLLMQIRAELLQLRS